MTWDDVPPGYFTALIRKHNFPPMWQPQTDFRRDQSEAFKSQQASHAREIAAKEGRGWGNGYIGMGNSPKNLAPGGMGEKRRMA